MAFTPESERSEKERKAMEAAGLNPAEWELIDECWQHYIVNNRTTGELRYIANNRTTEELREIEK